ncbi:cleavage and polyadenylation specificity factor subunit 2 [Cryptococcus wingfieldii CBS 7118]|uniref:Cleavage and polyadenylation specificity factor subunit 2 n=1 Tax=Cryptococcus wingfieldii CBS 7118 TaxID=1295528 RepID=A0A1E3J340_9TREE|nr:cleavage and polyadenylation specificity factor subunit 2 [Cryptococcus wingfieldii CBS 7118]ODN95264.1 cleavage and polyadenylation specificity factor subunit 2 [Cryptococcus wingfieldii CBS 7118]
MITLTPLSASANESSSSEPISYLLQLDDARILLDMGQRDYRASAQQTSWEYEEKVRELAPTLSLVLLSHSPANYLSLYPYARARWGLTCPVYATQPTVEMGRVVEGEEVSRKPLKGPLVATSEEIHEAFDWIKSVRYNQPLHLGGDCSHLLLTPFPSGHTLGGSLFKIRSPTSGTILYAVGINHTSERHLDAQNGPTGYADGVQRPDILIVESGRSLITNPKRKQREAALISLISSTLESNHSLLLPVDPSPRLLELLVLLDQHWTFKREMAMWPYPLCIVSRTAQDMITFARSLIEWMGGTVKDSGDSVVETRPGKKGRPARVQLGSEYGALDFRHLQFFASPADLLAAFPLSQPKLVLAVPPNMSHGPSRFLFTEMANAEGNVVLLTARGEEGTLGRDLFGKWEEKQGEGEQWGQGKIGKLATLDGTLQVEIDSKVPLEGAELEAHLESARLTKEREAAQKAALERSSRRMLEADDLESDSDDESDDGALAGAEEKGELGGATVKRAEGANAFAGDGEDVRTMSFDIYVKGQQMRSGRGAEMARFRMFPFVERKGRKIDQYGEGLDIGQWMRKGREIAEEGETEEVREARKRKEEEEEKAKVQPEVPSKFVNQLVSVDMKAQIGFVDMDGLHDGQSIKTIVNDLQPRKLILVRSTQEATQNLVTFLHSISGFTKDIFTPSLDEEIKIGTHVASYSLTLGDSITSALAKKWSEFEGYEVTMVDGKIILPAGSTIPILEASHLYQPLPKTEEAEGDEAAEEDVKPSAAELEAPPKEATPPPSAPTVSNLPLTLPTSTFIGDLRLARLKYRLSLLDPPIPAEFAGEGVLICGPGVVAEEKRKGGQVVAVRKVGEGRIVVEGSVGRIYGEVRKAVYGGLARVDSV